jgi:hypothetical protein
MPTEYRHAAPSNRAQYLPMGRMKPAEVAVDETIALRANNIGHLDEGPSHFFLRLQGRLPFPW